MGTSRSILDDLNYIEGIPVEASYPKRKKKARGNFITPDGNEMYVTESGNTGVINRPLEVDGSFQPSSPVERASAPQIDISIPNVGLKSSGPVSLGDSGSGGLSSSKGLEEFVGPPAPLSDAARTANATQSIADQMAANRQSKQMAQVAMAGLNLVTDVMNAKSAFDQLESVSQMNIYFAKLGASDAISRGATRANRQVSKGMQSGESALVYLAAQGLDIQSASASRVETSQEAIGLYNGMLEEINASREALGYEQKVVQLEYGVESARNQRDLAYLGAGMNFAASTATAFI